MLDLKIRNGSVPDFEAGAMLAADIGVKDGMIVSVGRVEEAAKAEIDAEGLVVSPGFIDIHMHEETLVPGAPEPYDIARYMLAMGVTTAAAGNCGNTRQAVRDFLDFIDANGSPINYLTFAGHNSIRARAGVASPYEAATPAQIEAMAGLVAEDIEAGAIGLSFGLEYSPAVSFAEMIGAAGGAAGREILLSAHYRSDGPDGLSSVRELIALSEETGQAMQVSHLVSCTGFGDMRESLESLAAAKARGVDVLADSYPYDAFCTRIGSAVFDDGCFERWGKGFGAIRFLQEPLRGTTCDEASFRLAREEYPDSLVAAFVMNDDEAVMAIAHPLVIVASDGIYNRGFGHPRGAGAFPRVLGRYSRERGALSLVEALRKMTLLPASRLRLGRKGRIAVGCDADLVVFDPGRIVDTADYDSPTLPPLGIEAVLIGGRLALSPRGGPLPRLGRSIRREAIAGWSGGRKANA